MKKVVLKLELHDDKIKQKAMKTASGLTGVESISMDMKDKKLTITGDIDPVKAVAKLRKLCRTDILSVGPSKEPEKKKDEPKKEEPKKVEPKKEDPKKIDTTKDNAAAAQIMMKAYYQQQAYYQQPQYHYQPQQAYYNAYNTSEEDPNACVIC